MAKKLFISADIEGTASMCSWKEAERNGDLYSRFCKLMSAEVASAARAALDLGWEVTVKDAHDSARNIDPEALPKGCRLIRGWTGSPLCMLGGLELEKYDAVAYTGYHADAFNSGNPLSHTMTTSAQRVLINGTDASEFMINAYAAAEMGIPSVFISGDGAICKKAEELVPGINSVATKTGIGGAVISKTPGEVCDDIYNEVKAALLSNISRLPEMPKHFVLEIEYKSHVDAGRYSYYPGAKRINEKTVCFEADDFESINRAVLFIL